MRPNNTYTKEQWNKDGSLSVNVGQLISEEVFTQLLECVPPKTFDRGIFQVGEPRNHDFAMRPLFDTFENTAKRSIKLATQSAQIFIILGINSGANRQENRYLMVIRL